MGQDPPLVVTPPPGPASRALAARLEAAECPAFDARRRARERDSGAPQAPIVYARARGANVFDVDGNRYVDLTAGFGALALGHGDEAVASAVARQSERISLALGDVYASDVKVELLERLAALHPTAGARVMLGTSGADAVTAALKTAVLATGRPGVIAFTGAYHGLSHGPLAACGFSAAFREPFAAQLSPHVRFVPYPEGEGDLAPCLDGVRGLLAQGTMGAVLCEPLLGRGGCVVPPAGLLAGLRACCTEFGALLVADEIWTGLGRAGAWLSSLDAGVVPDVVCVGKALGGGLPISACIGADEVMASWGAHGGTVLHTATHFGAPLACAAALATLDRIGALGLPEAARAKGAAFMAALRGALGPGARVAGAGLMVGVALDGGAPRALAVARRLLSRGYIVLTGGVNGDVLTLTPPLTIDGALLRGAAEAIGEVAAQEAARPSP